MSAVGRARSGSRKQLAATDSSPPHIEMPPWSSPDDGAFELSRAVTRSTEYNRPVPKIGKLVRVVDGGDGHVAEHRQSSRTSVAG